MYKCFIKINTVSSIIFFYVYYFIYLIFKVGPHIYHIYQGSWHPLKLGGLSPCPGVPKTWGVSPCIPKTFWNIELYATSISGLRRFTWRQGILVSIITAHSSYIEYRVNQLCTSALGRCSYQHGILASVLIALIYNIICT